jgi:uncharacterized protein (TIGR02246 family)
VLQPLREEAVETELDRCCPEPEHAARRFKMERNEMALPADDWAEIQQLYARYNTAIDTGDGDAFGGCFVPAGVFNPGTGAVEGQSAIGEYGVAAHEALPLMRHNATNIVVDVDGERATGSAFLIGYLAGPNFKVIVTGRYRDTLAKADGEWRFVERIFQADQ